MTKKNENKSEELCCGLVMPISSIDGCNEQHWSDVKGILTEAVEDAGFKANLVSYADDVGIIQKRIIQNLYENPIVVCDVSGKNPNVMFELGIRLAFDKPTIIVKDNETSYSFDTSPIEHLEYPRDLRFTKIVEFKGALQEKVQATLKKSKEDKNYTTFLKHFGTFTVAKLDTKEVSKEDFIIEELKELKKAVQQRQIIYTEREKVPGKQHYGKPATDALYSMAKSALKEAIVEELIKLPKDELKTPDLMDMIFDKIRDKKQVNSYFYGRDDLEVAFIEAYMEIVK